MKFKQVDKRSLENTEVMMLLSEMTYVLANLSPFLVVWYFLDGI